MELHECCPSACRVTLNQLISRLLTRTNTTHSPSHRGTPRVRDTSATAGSQQVSTCSRENTSRGFLGLHDCVILQQQQVHNKLRKHGSGVVRTGAAVMTCSDGKSCVGEKHVKQHVMLASPLGCGLPCQTRQT